MTIIFAILINLSFFCEKSQHPETSGYYTIEKICPLGDWKSLYPISYQTKYIHEVETHEYKMDHIVQWTRDLPQFDYLLFCKAAINDFVPILCLLKTGKIDIRLRCNTILWHISSVRLIFDSAKSAHRQSKPIDDKASGYWSPVFRTHPYGYNFNIRFHPCGIDATAGQFATLIFAFFPGDYDGLFRWPFPKAIHLSLRDQLDPLNAWTQTIHPTQEPPLRRPTSSLTNDAFAVAFYKYIPHSKLFSETDEYVVNDTCYIEVSFFDPNMQKSSMQKLPFSPFP